jgi:hypothetical protein
MEAVSGVVVAGSALGQAHIFLFLVETQISNAAARDSLGNPAPDRQWARI